MKTESCAELFLAVHPVGATSDISGPFPLSTLFWLGSHMRLGPGSAIHSLLYGFQSFFITNTYLA